MCLPQGFISNGHTSAGGTRPLEHLSHCLVEELSGICVEDMLVQLEWYQQKYVDSDLP